MAEKIEVEFVINSKDAVKNVKGLEKEVEGLQDQAKKSNKETEASVKKIGKTSKTSAKSVGLVSKGFKGLGLAMKAAGIGLVIAAMAGLKEIFSQNQKVVDLFSTAFQTFSGVVNQVVTAVINVYEAVAKSSENFNGLGKVLGGLITLGITPLKAGFYAIKLALQTAQLAWEESFFGDNDPETIKILNEKIKETSENMKEVAVDALKAGADIALNIGDAIGEVSNIGKIAGEELSKVSVTAAYEQAKVNVQLKNSAEIAAAQQSRLVEQYDRQAEQLRQIRDEERNSIADRKKANDDLLKVLEEQETAMLKQADLQIAAAASEVKKNNTIEAQTALIDALANKEGVLAQVEGFRSEQKANDLALDKEQIELTNTMLESESKLSIERQRFNAELIQDELTKLEKLKEIDELEAEQESVRLQSIVDNANAGTQAKIDAQIALDEFTELSRQTNLQRDIDINEAERQLDKQKIKDKKDVVDAIAQFADAESGIGQALLIMKQGLALKETIMDLKRITFKGVEAVGAAGVSTAQNVAESSKIGFPQNIITIASAIAQGVGIMRSVKKAVSKTKAKAGASAASVPSVSSPSAPSAPPAFNVVGASDTNQLAEAIGGQAQQPIQTYVVASEVSTAQELDRNIVTGATIG